MLVGPLFLRSGAELFLLGCREISSSTMLLFCFPLTALVLEYADVCRAFCCSVYIRLFFLLFAISNKDKKISSVIGVVLLRNVGKTA